VAFPLFSSNVELETVNRDRGVAAGFHGERADAIQGGGPWEASPLGHEEPRPEADEIVSFLTFYKCGLGHPAHPFLLVLLNEWGLELQYLNPNRVLHILSFVILCEGFLGIDPHTNLL
jgi:hypothetical protein